MLLIYQSSIKSQILDFIHWTVPISFSFDHMTAENRELHENSLYEITPEFSKAASILAPNIMLSGTFVQRTPAIEYFIS